MGDAPDNHGLDRRTAVLEERMNTMQADLSATLERSNAAFERLRADMAQRDAALSDRIAGAAERMATASDRNATAHWWQTGALLAGMAIATAAVIAAF